MTTIIVAALCIAAAYVLRRYLVAMGRSQKAHTWLRDLFYENASKIVEASDDVPDICLDVLEKISSDVASHKEAWRLLWTLVTGRARQQSNPSARAVADELTKSVASMRPELQDIFWRAFVAGVMAMTYRSVVPGKILRRLALFAVDAKEAHGSGEAKRLYLSGGRDGNGPAAQGAH